MFKFFCFVKKISKIYKSEDSLQEVHMYNTVYIYANILITLINICMLHILRECDKGKKA